jgi:hypothetical protein
VTTHEVFLKRNHIAMTDTRFSKRAKPCVDAVHRGRCIASCYDGIDSSTRCLNTRARIGAKRDSATSTRDVFEIRE